VKGGFVADSSVAISWALPSQASEVTEKLLDEVSGGASVVVPVLWGFEVANSLLVLERRKKITAGEGARARQAILALTPIVDEEGPAMALRQTAEMAAEHGLSVYDAAYLELARRRGLPLASRDDALNHAAHRCGVRVLL
jgi:predicted nucleic acid-binding protein